jgi:hypothetical protein
MHQQHIEILSRLEAAAGSRRGFITFVSMDITTEENKVTSTQMHPVSG